MTEAGEFADVGAVDDFPEGRLRVVEVHDRSVGVVQWKGEFLALRNICPHQYGPVCGGHAMRMIIEDSERTLEVDKERLVVVCPWHSWEFDAKTGKPIWASSRYRLTTYPTRVRSQRVEVGDQRVRN
jgi:nitrite reductase/ring-hydroxylating ferredoxin subunit